MSGKQREGRAVKMLKDSDVPHYLHTRYVSIGTLGGDFVGRSSKHCLIGVSSFSLSFFGTVLRLSAGPQNPTHTHTYTQRQADTDRQL